MPFDFDRLIERRNTDSLKYDFAHRWDLPEGLLPLWVADMDFPAPPAVLDELEKRVRHGIFGYSDDPGTGYFDALYSWYDKRFGWQIEDRWVVKMPGVVFAVCMAIQALTEKGDGILIQPPVYYPFSASIKENGRRVVENPLVYQDGRYTMDFADLEKKIAEEKVKMDILCSPHNPVGRVWTREELLQFGQICHKHGVIVVSDEIHADFVYPPGSFYSMLCIEAAASHTVCLSAPSKTYNIAGLKQATLVAKDKPMRQKIAFWLQQHGVVSGNLFAMVASKAAYTACDDWLDGLIAYLNHNRALLTSQLAHELPDAMITPIEATYLAWVHVRPYGTDQEALMASCSRHGVLPYSGVVYGRETGAGYIRINFGCPADQLTEGLSRFAAAMHDTLKQQGAGR